MKKFQNPEIEVLNVTVEDVITTSNCPTVTTEDEF